MKKRLLAATLPIFLFTTACSAPQGQSGGGAFPPVPVAVGQASQESVPIQAKAVGTAEAYSTVEVKSQVAGILTHVYFREGQDVRKGQLLFEIDPVPTRTQ